MRKFLKLIMWCVAVHPHLLSAQWGWCHWKTYIN